MADSRFESLLTNATFPQEPHGVYRMLREEAPVYWSDAWGAWLLTRYDDAVATLRDHETFSSKGRLVELIDALPPSARSEAGPLREHFSTSGLIHTDPPDHTRLRSLIKKAFSPRVIAAMEPRIQRIVDELLDQTEPGETFDLVARLAYPLPAIVIAELLGARAEDRDDFKGWSDGIVAFQGQGRAIPEAIPISAAAVTHMRAYIAALVAAHREVAQDDLVGQLAAVEEAGEQLSMDEIYSTCVTFLIGGHETTTSLIANCLYRLLHDREQLELARSDDRALGRAIEESLRYDSPIQRTFRRVSEDTEYEGVAMRADQIVIQLLGAANRDPQHFERPEAFDVSRQPNRHIAFGSGVHFCIGAPLARLEARTALRSILDRMPDIEIASEDITWQSEKALFRCVRELPVHSSSAAIV